MIISMITMINKTINMKKCKIKKNDRRKWEEDGDRRKKDKEKK